MSGKHIFLDPRLSMIAAMIGICECCADIGCDHGRLDAFLLQSGQCQRAQLTEISEPSLEKAKRLISLLGLSGRVTFCVGDGAKALAGPADVAVIAGMGGGTIARIIRAGREKLGAARLILQPNVGAPELRSALCACGYRITNECVARDGRRNYVIIEARPGGASYSERELIVGPVLLQKLPKELRPYAEFRLRVARKALQGAQAAEDAAQADALRREAGIWEEVCEWLRK